MEESGSTPSNGEDFDAFRKLYARNLALGEIMHKTRFGEVEGISFDLRHSDINPDEWEMNHLGGDDGRPPHRDEELPFIWFPWYGKFDPDLLKAEVVKEYEYCEEDRKKDIPRFFYGNVTDEEYERLEAERKAPSPLAVIDEWIRDRIAERTPDAIVTPGDCISIHNVQLLVYNDDKFISIEERAEIHVFVKITDVNGLGALLARPIIMKGASRLSYGRGKMPIYSIMYRIRRHHKLERFSELPDEFWDDPTRQGYAYRALSRAIKIHKNYLPRVWKLQHRSNHSSWRIGRSYLEALDCACMLGYYWAQFENEVSMRPLAESGSRSRDGARSGGKNSGAVRAKRPWRLHAEELLQQIKGTGVNTTPPKIAVEIYERWKLSLDGRPSVDTLTRWIRKTGMNRVQSRDEPGSIKG